MEKITQQIGVLALIALAYLILLVGFVRIGALMINERDDLAFVGAIVSYTLIVPATLVFVTLAYPRVYKLLKGDKK